MTVTPTTKPDCLVSLLTGLPVRCLQAPGWEFDPNRLSELADAYEAIGDAVLRGGGADAFVEATGRCEGPAFLDEWAYLWRSIAGPEDPERVAILCWLIADDLRALAPGLDWQAEDDAEFAIGLKTRRPGAVLWAEEPEVSA